MKKNKIISSVLATSIFWVSLSGAFIYIKDYSDINIPFLKINNEKVEVLKINKNILVGEEIKVSDLKLVKEFTNKVVPGAITDSSKVVGKIAQRNLYINEQVKVPDFIDKNMKQQQLRPCLIPIKLNNLSDNAISKGHVVDVICTSKKMKEKPEIVASKVVVKSVLDSKGEPLTNQRSSDNKQIPAYITFMTTLDNILLINDALKYNTLTCVDYIDQNAKPSKLTYVPSWEKQKLLDDQKKKAKNQ